MDKKDLLILKKDLVFNCYILSLLVEKIVDLLTDLSTKDKDKTIYNSYQYDNGFKFLLDLNLSFTKFLLLLDMDNEDYIKWL